MNVFYLESEDESLGISLGIIISLETVISFFAISFHQY